MKLNKFFKNLKKNHGEIRFKGFDFDSKKIKKNYIFFAIKGINLMATTLLKMQ